MTIADSISCALNSIGHPDFSVAIKLYKNPIAGHLAGFPVNLKDWINTLFIAARFPAHINTLKKKPLQHALGNRKGLKKRILNVLVRSYVPPLS